MSSGENHIVEGEGPCDPGQQEDTSSDPKKDSLTGAAPDEKKAKTLHDESTDPTANHEPLVTSPIDALISDAANNSQGWVTCIVSLKQYFGLMAGLADCNQLD